MTIQLFITPPWLEDETTIVVEGSHELAIANVAVAQLLAGGYDVEVEDEDGERISYLEYDHG